MKKSNTGFTLIELLVVIAIIGILAAVLFITINPADKIAKANNATAKADLAGISTDIQMQYDTDSYSYENACNVAAVTTLKTKYDGTGAKGTAHCAHGTNDGAAGWAVDVIKGSATGAKSYCLSSASGQIEEDKKVSDLTCVAE